AASGALVFGAGTIQWSWGLDTNHDPASATAVDIRIQQATLNLLADMAAQPATIQPGLVASTASSDVTAPVATSTTTTGQTVASGWQSVLFSSPVSITAGTTYVASYFAPVGHYSGDNWTFKQSGAGNGPMHALKSGVDGLNGIFRYSSTPIFPNDSFRDSNYWV